MYYMILLIATILVIGCSNESSIHEINQAIGQDEKNDDTQKGVNIQKEPKDTMNINSFNWFEQGTYETLSDLIGQSYLEKHVQIKQSELGDWINGPTHYSNWELFAQGKVIKYQYEDIEIFSEFRN
jgi:hypothetical protein